MSRKKTIKTQQIQIIQGDLKYFIHEKDKIAEIASVFSESLKILIPRSITYNSDDYLVTKIHQNAFKKGKNVKSIEFESDSKIQTINKLAFSSSSIETITIPP